MEAAHGPELAAVFNLQRGKEGLHERPAIQGLLRDGGRVLEGRDPRIPDFSDTFVYIQSEALFPRHHEYETVFSEEFSLEGRIEVAGIPVSIKLDPSRSRSSSKAGWKKPKPLHWSRTSRRASRPTRGCDVC